MLQHGTSACRWRVLAGCFQCSCAFGCLLQETDEHGLKPGYLFKQFLSSLGNLSESHLGAAILFGLDSRGAALALAGQPGCVAV